MIYNRDLSWLGFNHLVLQQANNPDLPVYERMKFLAIFSSNLDEFFRIRYPALIALSMMNKKVLKKEAVKQGPGVVEEVQARISAQLTEFGEIFLEKVIPELKEHGIHFYYNEKIRHEHFREVREIFVTQVLSFIQPILLGSEAAVDFMPENNQLYFAVTLTDPVKNSKRHMLVNIPSNKLKRFYVLSDQEDQHYVVFIDDIIRENISMLFPGQKVEGVYSLKVNRDAELELLDEYSFALLDKMEKQLARRDFGTASRFLFENGMPPAMQVFLASLFQVNISDMFEGGRYHNLSDLNSFPVFDKKLQFPPFKAMTYPPAAVTGDIFNAVIEKDILIHLPYHSYSPVLSFFNQAAVDEDVTHIYITLYRVAAESHIANALISAARNGKKVTAFIELKARFDEANNIRWSRLMKQAGITIIYSEPLIKVHSKIAVVHKNIGKQSVSFAVLSTGNFNESTARFYTDHVLFTVRREVVKEMMALFEFLQQKKAGQKKAKFRELSVSRFNMVNDLENLITKEVRKVEKGGKGLIRIKVNNLEEPWFINQLYKASKAGVEVRIIARSVCCVVPGVKGLSDNITVRRIVDRFLEHTRIVLFGVEDPVILMGSSDLMTRNLRHRIEVCMNIVEDKCRRELEDYFEMQWKDNTNAVEILPDHSFKKVENGLPPFNAQKEIFNYLSNQA